MKNNLLFFIILSITVISIIINHKFNNSLKEQSILIYEFNNSGSLDYPLDRVKEFNHTFPNITVTTLPIALLKARYYLKHFKPVEALELIHNSKQFNPYLGIAASLACGYLGLIEKRQPRDAFTTDAYALDEELPKNLSDALDLFDEASAIHEVLHPDFCRIYSEVKRIEYTAYQQVISPWEREHLLMNV